MVVGRDLRLKQAGSARKPASPFTPEEDALSLRSTPLNDSGWWSVVICA
jgi:hypothetical protein